VTQTAAVSTASVVFCVLPTSTTSVCSRPECQRRRRADYHRRKLEADPEYVRSPTTARRSGASSSDYLPHYPRATSGSSRTKPRTSATAGQSVASSGLKKNNLALDLKRSAAEVWMVGPRVAHLDKNNLASTQVFIFGATWRQDSALRVLERTTLWLLGGPARIPKLRPMLSAEQINGNHRLHGPCTGPSAQDRPSSAHRAQTNAKYLARRRRPPLPVSAPAKLDPFKPAIAEFLEQDAHALPR